MTGGSARRGRWRVAARIARRDARRHRARTALVVALAGLPVLVGSAIAVYLQSAVPTLVTQMRWGLGDEAQARIDAPMEPGIVQDELGSSAGGGSGAVDVALTLSRYEDELRAALPPGDELLRTVTVLAGVTGAEGVAGSEWLASLPAADLSGPYALKEGRFPTSAGEVALDQGAAQRTGAAVGGSLTLTIDGAERTVVVTGLLAPGTVLASMVTGPGALPAPGPAFAPIPSRNDPPAAVVTWYVAGPAAVTWDDVQAVNRLGSTVLSRAVALDPPPRASMPFYDQVPSGPDTQSLAVIAVVAALVLVEVVLLIGPAFAVAARRSQHHLATLAAVGADRATLRASVLLVGVLTGAVAAVGGVVGGVLAAAAIRAVVSIRSPFALPELRAPWWPLVALAGFGVAVTTLAAWPPARRASRVDVVAALGGRRAEAAPRRRVPVVGLLAAAIGLAVTVVGSLRGLGLAAAAGVLVLELGVVATTGSLVTLASRVAPRLPLGARLALRDAARHRSRTAPAVAAVLAASAGATAGLVYAAASAAHDVAIYDPVAAVGTVMVNFPDAPTDDELRAAEEGIRREVPVASIAVVRFAAAATDADTPVLAQVGPAPHEDCPYWSEAHDLTIARLRAAAGDPRCESWTATGVQVWSAGAGAVTLVDDGSAMRALGLPGSEDAARALEAGRVTVHSRLALWPDGTAELSTTDGTIGAAPSPSVRLPATVVDLSPSWYSIVLPESALVPLGLTSRVGGLVIRTERPITMPEYAQVADVAHRNGGGEVVVEHGPPDQHLGLTAAALTAGAVVAGLLATGIAVALAAADSVPDLATLAAVGAPPRMRRRFAAGQAGVIAALGAWLGVATGLVLGWALVQMQAARELDLAWRMAVPWPAVVAATAAVPLAAMALGWLTSRSRLPMVRRIAA